MQVDREMVQAYRQRWQAVAEIEAFERQQETVTERWQKLNALLRMGVALGLNAGTSRETDPLLPHQRWNQLRQMYLAAKQENRVSKPKKV